MIHPFTPEHAVEELAEEIGALAERGERHERGILSGSKVPDPASVLAEMERRDLVRREAGEVSLTPQGQALASAVLRRHRLAEVLLGEVLQVAEPSAGDAACEFEHMLSREVADSICTFLGHPPVCPHGKAIPRGDCCAAFRTDLEPLVRPLADLRVGSEGRIVFIQGARQPRLDRLATLGVLPGSKVRLVQRHPSVVLDAGETTLALDPEIARAIYVRPVWD